MWPYWSWLEKTIVIKMKISRTIEKIRIKMQKEFKHICCIVMAIGLMVYGLREHVNLFISVNKLKNQSDDYEGRTLRLGAIVKKNSIKKNGSKIEFEVTDIENKIDDGTLKVIFNGVPPSLFKEDKAMVADGIYRQGVFYAREILAKHDENYQIPEGR